MTAVAQVTNSTVSIEFLIELGKRKAGKFKSSATTLGMPPEPLVPLLTDFDKGWLEGLKDTFTAFKENEINIDTSSETFIPLKVIESIIQHGHNEAEARNKEERRKFDEMQAYKKKQDYNKKDIYKNPYTEEPLYPKKHQPTNPYPTKESQLEALKRREEALRRKKKFNSQYEAKTDTPHGP
jgi:hypothetical protein